MHCDPHCCSSIHCTSTLPMQDQVLCRLEQGLELPSPAMRSTAEKNGRKTGNWRPLSAADVAYSYVDESTGLPVRRNQAYKSSPIEQMMKQIVAREDATHDAAIFYAMPEVLRLKQQLRKYKLK
eukprot:6193584-Pleurochrysis_carterae.AAC.4